MIENNLSHKSGAKSTLYNVALNAGNTFLFNKGFCTVYFGEENKNAVTLPHSEQREHDFAGKIKNMSKKINFQQEKKLL